VERLVAYGYARDGRTIEAMKKVPRHAFVPEDLQRHAYDDRPLPVGEGQTISAPHMVAMMCDYLGLEKGQKVLEIGAGTGYHACVIARIVHPGRVLSVERIESLGQRARANLERAGCEGTEVVVGDGTLGYEKEAPYDRILVTAGAPEVPPPLIDQLKPGGRLVIPVGGRFVQDLVRIVKGRDGEIFREDLGGCAFVPLVGEYGW